MHDQRVVGGTALRGVDAGDGGGARGVCAEAVDGFGGEGDGVVGVAEVVRCQLKVLLGLGRGDGEFPVVEVCGV